MKLVYKFILMLVGIMVIYNTSVYLFAVPTVNNTIELQEEKNAKLALNEIVVLATNANTDLLKYKKRTLAKDKQELQDLTDTAWSIIQKKYDQTKPKNISSVLQKRSQEFEKNLTSFYNKNRDKMSQKELKKAIKNYVDIYRYANSVGYFWINDFTPTMILHPTVPKLNGKYLGNYKDANGVYLFDEMVKVCKKSGSGIVKYQWLNPKNHKIENKISYVFTFKPYHWIIGTGEYENVLRKRLQKEVIDLVRNLRYGNGNYFFIYDYNNIAIAHPYIQGKDMSNVKDKKGNLIVPPFIKLAREKGEGFSSYWWQKNSVDGKSYQKLTFVKNFKNWKMVIATGMFIDEIEREAKTRKKEMIEQLSKIVRTTKIGKNGYLYIFDGNGNMIIHPDSTLSRTNFKSLKNPQHNTLLFDDLVKASQTKSHILKYKWNISSDKSNYIYDKISWVRYIPELDWYVASSVYTQDIKKSSHEISRFILLFSIILFIIILFFISILFTKYFLKPILTLSRSALKIADGDYTTRCGIKSDDEFGMLAKYFNKMVDKTEDLINNLDEKIISRTEDLERAKKEIEAIHKHTRESIEYAALIQEAIISQELELKPFFKDSFVHWIPKDTVGGDIWLFNELRNEDECLLFCIDCTGHGVPGAFVSMIVKAIEKEIISTLKKDNSSDISPSNIMSHFNTTMKRLLKQTTPYSKSNAGFDGAIIYYNRRSQILKFAGAQTPLFYIDENDELKIIKGDRYSVGYKKCSMDYEYKESIINVKEGMKFYCTTDGYLDQNGGAKDFPFGKRRFGNIIKENSQHSMERQKEIFIDNLAKYEAQVIDNDRNDDITVIAFEIGKKSSFREEKLEILKYKGMITQNVIASCMDNIEDKIANMGIRGNISTITIEYCQNMMNYSKNREIDSQQIVPMGSIEVHYYSKNDNEYYEVVAINIVSTQDKEKIEPKLIEIQSLDKEAIKKRYRELRKSGENTHEKGGGIGIYEIVKASNSIEYEFKAINQDKYIFTMKSVIKPKNRKRIDK